MRHLPRLPTGGAAGVHPRRNAMRTALQWRGRADMMAKSDAYSIAYDDYVRALKLDPLDEASLKAFVRTAILTNRAQDALSWVKSLTLEKPSVHAQIAVSKLLAASCLRPRRSKPPSWHATRGRCAGRVRTAGALYADAGDSAQLDPVLKRSKRLAPAAASTRITPRCRRSFVGMRKPHWTPRNRRSPRMPNYAAAYDMAGAAHTRLGQADLAARPFRRRCDLIRTTARRIPTSGCWRLRRETRRGTQLLRGSAVAHSGCARRGTECRRSRSRAASDDLSPAVM